MKQMSIFSLISSAVSVSVMSACSDCAGKTVRSSSAASATELKSSSPLNDRNADSGHEIELFPRNRFALHRSRAKAERREDLDEDVKAALCPPTSDLCPLTSGLAPRSPSRAMLSRP